MPAQVDSAALGLRGVSRSRLEGGQPSRGRGIGICRGFPRGNGDLVS